MFSKKKGIVDGNTIIYVWHKEALIKTQKNIQSHIKLMLGKVFRSTSQSPSIFSEANRSLLLRTNYLTWLVIHFLPVSLDANFKPIGRLHWRNVPMILAVGVYHSRSWRFRNHRDHWVWRMDWSLLVTIRNYMFSVYRMTSLLIYIGPSPLRNTS